MSREEILDRLNIAKWFYIRTANLGHLHGMCFCLTAAFGLDFGYQIREIIPEFNSMFLLGKDIKYLDYWWPLKDTESRLGAFDKLIAVYEKDNTVCETNE